MSRARDLGGRAVDALQNRNLIVNGGMQIHQRGTSISGQTAYFYGPADRWTNRLTSVGTWTGSIETDVPLGTNLTKSMKYLCTTAAGTYAGGERFAIVQTMEYQNMYKILKPNSYNKKQISVSFWVKSNVIGKYSVEIYAQDTSVGSSSGNQGRRVAIPYNILTANTWERKTITFPEDNLGRIYVPQGSGEALIIMFWGAGGPLYKTGTYTNTWDDVIQGNRYPSDGVNIGSAVGNYWQFTGVQMEVSPSVTDFEYTPYTQELLECQRFFERKFIWEELCFARDTNLLFFNLKPSVEMRAPWSMFSPISSKSATSTTVSSQIGFYGQNGWLSGTPALTTVLVGGGLKDKTVLFSGLTVSLNTIYTMVGSGYPYFDMSAEI
jgi:hypothetical protein